MAASDTRKFSRKQRAGRVVGDAMDKTIVVLVESRIPDPKYGKMVRHRKRIFVHDEKNEARKGDVVRVAETRPLSRMKRWRLVEIVERAPDRDQPAGEA